MLNLKILATTLVASALSLATGSSSTAQPNQIISPAPSPTTQTVQATETPSPNQSGQTTLSSSDRQFMKEAARGDLAEVQLGKLASQRGFSDAVKQYGQRMVKDHTQTSNQLQQVAIHKGVTLPKKMDKEDQKLRKQLSKLSGANFDRTYINHMVEDHTEDVSSYQRQAQQGQDSDVKAFAAQTVPILQEHLQLARSIANTTKSTNTTTPTNSP